MEGPISWITSGKVDAVLDIRFPRDPQDEFPLGVLLDGITDALQTSFPNIRLVPGQRELAKPPLTAPQSEKDEAAIGMDGEPRVIIDMDLRFRDLKAAVPIFTSDLSYVNNALIRPIVAFMK